MTTQKQSALQTIEEKKSLIAGIADKVWEFAELSLQEFKSAETYCEAPVSYTHLDVYKRQNVDRTIITDTSMFHKDLFVFDVIYNPQETRLLREAKEAGCKTGNGMYKMCIRDRYKSDPYRP